MAKLDSIKSNASSAQSSATSALSEAQAIRDELGAQGQTPDTYAKLKQLESTLKEVQTAASSISASQIATSELATQILSSLTSFVNQASSALGITGKDISVENLSAEQAKDEENVYEKLNEINAKLDAMKQSVETNEVVVKTWFEAE